MALLEGFRVQNYRALRDVTLGKTHSRQKGSALTPLTVVIGKNGVGKSTLFDAFGFVADCLNLNVEAACEAKPRGSFERLRSLGTNEPIKFEIYYREAKGERPITYELEIGLDQQGRPFVHSEILRQRRKGQTHGRPYPFLNLSNGEGFVWAGEQGLGTGSPQDEEETAKSPVTLTDPRQLGIATLGTLIEHPRIKRFRDFLKGWYLSYFYPDAARELSNAGAQKRLSIHGDNIGNVVQYLEREHKTRFETILKRIASKIPGIEKIETIVTEDKRVLLKFNDGAFRSEEHTSELQ